MKQNLEISQISIFLLEKEVLDKKGNRLLGWCSCVVNNCLFLNGITIKEIVKTNTYFLVFPARKSKNQKKHFYFRPTNSETLEVFKEEIIEKHLKKILDGKKH